MRTFSAISELTVIVLSSGEEIGKVIDIMFDKTIVIGLIIDQYGWLNRHLFVPIEKIHAWGQDALTIHDKKNLSTFDKKNFPYYSLYIGSKKIVGKTLMSTEGEKLGLVEDVYFQEDLGNIVGYEVTDGFIADIKEGKHVFRTSTPLTVGEDVLVIDLNC